MRRSAVAPSFPLPAVLIIDIETTTNGIDADLPTGPQIDVGDPVLWQYIVTNIGDTDLFSVLVTDNQGVTVSARTTTLAPCQSMTAVANGTSRPGQYANIGSVCGRDSLGVQVCNDDPSHYLGVGTEPDRMVPTPASYFLVGIGLLGFVGLRRTEKTGAK